MRSSQYLKVYECKMKLLLNLLDLMCRYGQMLIVATHRSMAINRNVRKYVTNWLHIGLKFSKVFFCW
jgi:uncharacterized membrane protein